MVHVVATANLQHLNVAGSTIGPLEEGREYEMRYWIAAELARRGYVRFREDECLSFAVLNKIHWRETKLQVGLQLSALPEQFYPKLRRYLASLRERLNVNSVFNEYAQATRLAKDIVNCRLKKIVNLAANPAGSTSAVSALTKEEQFLFEEVKNVVAKWGREILKIDST
ncbi:MAG: hypothetical protein QXI32_01405 [Candidatus Bathyarchaeia archaeon]